MKRYLAWLAVAWVLSACGDKTVPGLASGHAPRFALGGVGRPSVLVNPNASANGTARTIQEGIDMVGDGGEVMVLPGTYNEKVTINKGVTLEGLADGSGPVVIEQVFARVPTPGFKVATAESSAVLVTTSDPVEIRNVTVHHVWVRGLNAFAAPNLTLDGVSVLGEWDSLTVLSGNGVNVVSRAADNGGRRAQLVVRNSHIDVDAIAIALGGDVDALIEHNVLGGAISERNTKGTRLACLRVNPTGTTHTVSGANMQTNVDFRDNELIDCGVNNAVAVNIASDTGTSGTTATGQVNIVGNTIVFSSTQTKTPCNATAISYQYYSGRIENNSVISAVNSSCAMGTAPAAAIRVGNAPASPTVRAATVSVRFNDIVGNAFGGLRVRSNQPSALTATCNYWGGSAPTVTTGLAVGAAGGGQDIVVETGAATPMSSPYATAPIAGTDATGC
jgi:hypothetical protein